jgi:hypothetical protein
MRQRRISMADNEDLKELDERTNELRELWKDYIKWWDHKPAPVGPLLEAAFLLVEEASFLADTARGFHNYLTPPADDVPPPYRFTEDEFYGRIKSAKELFKKANVPHFLRQLADLYDFYEEGY